MAWRTRAALLAMCLAGVTTQGLAAALENTAAPAKDASNGPSPSLDGMVGKKLIAIDGSTIALMPAEGGLTREIVGPTGAVQKTMFEFINDKLGTVADGKNVSNVIGVFRATGAGLEINYADGSSETLATNPAGGITLESISAANDSCTAWYPEGHMFSLEERKAQLAKYATHLGLGDATDKKLADAKLGCSTPAAPRADVPPKVDAVVRQAGIPRPLTTPPTTAAAAAATAATAAAASAAAGIAKPVMPDLRAVEVRASEVHPVDANAAPEAQAGTKVASLEPAKTAGSPEVQGASECLSVESDGMHWGFRNHCGYSVQFAYCQMSGKDQLASCRDGTLSGSVAANGFGTLVADESLKEVDAVHDFRWVACQGGAGEVVARLDQTNPPAGRCVH